MTNLSLIALTIQANQNKNIKKNMKKMLLQITQAFYITTEFSRELLCGTDSTIHVDSHHIAPAVAWTESDFIISTMYVNRDMSKQDSSQKLLR